MAEWRFLLFTIIVTVTSPIWNVIRIVSPPFGDVTNRLPFVQRLVFTVPQFSTNCNICFIWPRRAQQCRVRTQSAAVLSSHAPHDSKARLGIRGEATYTAPDCAARAALRATDCQCKRGRGARPLVLSLGGLRGMLSFEKESIPFLCTPARRGNSSPLCERHYSLFGSGSPASELRYRYSPISSRKPARTSSLSSGVNSTPSGLSS